MSQWSVNVFLTVARFPFSTSLSLFFFSPLWRFFRQFAVTIYIKCYRNTYNLTQPRWIYFFFLLTFFRFFSQITQFFTRAGDMCIHRKSRPFFALTNAAISFISFGFTLNVCARKSHRKENVKACKWPSTTAKFQPKIKKKK